MVSTTADVFVVDFQGAKQLDWANRRGQVLASSPDTVLAVYSVGSTTRDVLAGMPAARTPASLSLGRIESGPSDASRLDVKIRILAEQTGVSKVRVHVIGTAATSSAVAQALKSNSAVQIAKNDVRHIAPSGPPLAGVQGAAKVAASNVGRPKLSNPARHGQPIVSTPVVAEHYRGFTERRMYDIGSVAVMALSLTALVLIAGALSAVASSRYQGWQGQINAEVAILFDSIALPLVLASILGAFASKISRELSVGIVLGVSWPALILAGGTGRSTWLSVVSEWPTRLELGLHGRVVADWLGNRARDLDDILLLLPADVSKGLQFALLFGIGGLILKLAQLFTTMTEA